MQVTLKQVVQTLELISKNHSNLKDFGFGDVWELEGKKREYPLLWVEVLPTTLGGKVMSIQLRIYVMTRVDKGEFGELDMQSETLLTLNDVLILMKRQYELIDEDSTATATPFTERFGDEVTGWFAEVNINIPSIYGNCDVPLEV